jgi:hypothetical protein
MKKMAKTPQVGIDEAPSPALYKAPVTKLGAVAEWLCRGLQILVCRFDSGPCLQLYSLKLSTKNPAPGRAHTGWVKFYIAPVLLGQIIARIKGRGAFAHFKMQLRLGH